MRGVTPSCCPTGCRGPDAPGCDRSMCSGMEASSSFWASCRGAVDEEPPPRRPDSVRSRCDRRHSIIASNSDSRRRARACELRAHRFDTSAEPQALDRGRCGTKTGASGYGGGIARAGCADATADRLCAHRLTPGRTGLRGRCGLYHRVGRKRPHCRRRGIRRASHSEPAVPLRASGESEQPLSPRPSTHPVRAFRMHGCGVGMDGVTR